MLRSGALLHCILVYIWIALDILIKDLQYHINYFEKYFQDNHLTAIYFTDIKEADLYIYRFKDNSCIKPITIKSYWTRGKVEAYHSSYVTDTTYTTFEFIGLKSYNDTRDTVHKKLLNDFITMLSNLSLIDFRITKIDLSFDFHVNKSIQNFFPVRVSKKGMNRPLNDPFNYYENTTFYIENRDIKSPSLKTYIYDKSIKENIIDTKILRFEVSVRNIGVNINTYESIIDYIEERLSYYQLFYFDATRDCNTIQQSYKRVMKTETKLSNFLLNKISRFNGQEIKLSISNEINHILYYLW